MNCHLVLVVDGFNSGGLFNSKLDNDKRVLCLLQLVLRSSRDGTGDIHKMRLANKMRLSEKMRLAEKLRLSENGSCQSRKHLFLDSFTAVTNQTQDVAGCLQICIFTCSK
jgi:hypothetical protein